MITDARPLDPVKDYLKRFKDSVRPWSEPRYPIALLGLSYQCQCSCPHCGVSAGPKGAKGALSEEETCALISEFPKVGVQWVNFFGGEPLMARGFFRFARHASSRGLRCVLDTNGLLLDGNAAGKLKAAGINQVNVSLDSPHLEEHDRLRGVAGAFEKAWRALDFCVKEGIPASVSSYATKRNLANGDLRRLLAMAKDRGVGVRLATSIRAGNWRDRDDQVLSPEEIRDFRTLLSEGVFWELSEVDGVPGTFQCPAGSRMFYIAPNGDVQPCCYCDVSFGSVLKEPLSAILSRLSASRMADGFQGGDCPLNDQRFRSEQSSLLENRRFSTEIEAAAQGRWWDARSGAYSEGADPAFGLNDEAVSEALDAGGRSVLDAGCGTGRLAARIAAAASSVTLLDISEEMLARARRRLDGSGRLSFRKGDIGAEAFDLGSFDRVAAVGLLKHVGDPSLAAERLRVAVEPGGILVLAEAVEGSDAELAAFHDAYLESQGRPGWEETFLRGETAPLMRGLLGGRLMSMTELEALLRPLLPGMTIRRLNGIFALVRWRRPS